MDEYTAQQLDVLVIGGASIDTFIFPEESKLVTDHGKNVIEFPYGSKIPVKEVHTEVGGGGANTAVGLARHGLKTALITKIGKDRNGAYIRERLTEEGVDTSLLLEGRLNTSSSVVIQGADNERTILTYRGTNAELVFTDIPDPVIANSRYILVNALYGDTSVILPSILNRAKEKGVKVAVSLGRSEMLFLGASMKNMLSNIFLLVVNEEEATELYHILTDERHTPEEECPSCSVSIEGVLTHLKHEGIANIGITLGAKGVIFIDEENKHYTIPAQQAQVINTTGLGDAFYSGLLSYIVMGKSIEESIIHGTKNAAAVMQHLGAQIGLLRN